MKRLIIFFLLISQSVFSQSYTAYVDTLGDDNTAVIGDPAKPFKTLDAALLSTQSLPKRVIKIGIGTFASHSHAAYIKVNTIIEGSGKPSLNNTITGAVYPSFTTTNPTALTGGTIFQGTFEVPNVSNVQLSDFGVDVGSAFRGSNSSMEGFMISADTIGTTGTYTNQNGKQLRQNIVVKNITVLQKDSSSLVHTFLIENCYNPIVDNITTWGGFAGFVSKNTGGRFTNLDIRSASANYYGIIIKKNFYYYFSNIILDGFRIERGGGMAIHNENGDGGIGMRSVIVRNGYISNTSYGVKQIGSQLQNINISGVSVFNCLGIAFDFSNINNSTIDNNSNEKSGGVGFSVNGSNVTVSNNNSFGGTSQDYVLNGTSSCLPIISYNNRGLSRGFNYGLFVYGSGNYGNGKTGALLLTSEINCDPIDTLHYSTFTAANSTLITSYTPEKGNVWSNIAGAWNIQNNQASVSSFPTGNNALCFTNIDTSNSYITTYLTLSNSTSYGQIWAKALNSANGVVVHITTNQTIIYNVVSGGATALGTYSVANGTSENMYEVITTGSTITVKRNGVTVGGVNIPTSQTGKSVGIGSAGTSTPNTVRFNSFLVMEN